MITISEASSHQNSRSSASVSETTDETNATVIASAISSIMPGWRLRASSMPPVRNGRPPYEVDDGAEHGCDPLRSRERPVVVEPFLDLFGEHEDGNRECEVAPERDPEHVGVARMTATTVVALFVVAVIVVSRVVDTVACIGVVGVRRFPSLSSRRSDGRVRRSCRSLLASSWLASPHGWSAPIGSAQTTSCRSARVAVSRHDKDSSRGEGQVTGVSVR